MLEVQQGCCGGGNQKRDAEVVQIATPVALASPKLGLSVSGKVGGASRVTLGRVGVAHATGGLDVEPSEVTLVEVAGLVSAGGGCCPSVVALPVDGDIESEASVDFFDVVPAGAHAPEGIHDQEPLVIEVKFGADEDQPGNHQGEAACCQAKGEVLGVGIKQQLNGHHENHDANNAGHHEIGPGTKTFSIGHKPIIAGHSRKVSVAFEKGQK